MIDSILEGIYAAGFINFCASELYRRSCLNSSYNIEQLQKLVEKMPDDDSIGNLVKER